MTRRKQGLLVVLGISSIRKALTDWDKEDFTVIDAAIAAADNFTGA
jgi:hypothetical protein